MNSNDNKELVSERNTPTVLGCREGKGADLKLNKKENGLCYHDEMNERVVIDFGVCHGKSCIRGTRIMVSNILNLLAHGANVDEVVQGYPQLTREDVFAALEYAEAIVRDEDIHPAFV